MLNADIAKRNALSEHFHITNQQNVLKRNAPAMITIIRVRINIIIISTQKSFFFLI